MRKVFNLARRGILLSAFALTMSSAISMSVPMGNVKAYVVETKNPDGTYTYTNTDTNESITSVWPSTYADDYIGNELKTWTIETKSYYNTIYLESSMDAAKLANFRSNNKNLKVKVMYKHESDYGCDHWDSASEFVDTPDGKRLYKDAFGNRKVFNAETKKEIEKTNKDEAYGIYKIRLYAKKAGKYEFSYDSMDGNGNVFATRTIKIAAKDDGDPIKEATFAGKRFYVSNAQQQAGVKANLYDKKGAYQTKKSSKLKITMNKGFTLKKVEIGYQGAERTKNSTEDNWSNKLSEKVWKEVKNGKKIKLYTNDYTQCMDSYKKSANKNAPDGYDIYSDENKSHTAVTYIRVTYYDKKNKTTEQTELTLGKLIK